MARLAVIVQQLQVHTAAAHRVVTCSSCLHAGIATVAAENSCCSTVCRDGISLKTLYRQAASSKASLLVVRDRQQQVFGCFASEMWRVAPRYIALLSQDLMSSTVSHMLFCAYYSQAACLTSRSNALWCGVSFGTHAEPTYFCRYYGTGECFVFQLQPQLLCWRWWQKKMQQTKNDYFQFGTPEALAMGGGPHYAIRLDADLSMGSSGTSSTFGSPCLASQEEFQIGKVELWGLG